MRKLRGSLTYANVMSTLCFFLLLSGGAAYAASHLGKNSVGTGQIRNNAVTAAKIRNGAVTAAKIPNGSLTGTQINASTLGTVPTAQTAQSAQTAQKANTIAASEEWHVLGAAGEPALLGGCVNANEPGITAPPAGFYKDQEGVVHLRGSLSECRGFVLFELPPGFRPSKGVELSFPVFCECVDSVLFVNGSEGKVVTNGSKVSLDGITFKAES